MATTKNTAMATANGNDDDDEADTALPMATHPKGSGPYLRDKPLQMIKALTATGWGKQKETLMATYNAVMNETGSGVCLFHMVVSCIID